MSGSLPLLPGYRIETHSKRHHAKSHVFDVSAGVRRIHEEKVEKKTPAVPDLKSTFAIQRTEDASLRATSKPTIVDKTTLPLSHLPKWVAFDRKVLRFYAYFEESVAASAVEEARIRKCIIYYYLEDDTTHVAEPKVENSGIPQGVFIKRHRIPKTDGSILSLDDLIVGNNLALYGRLYHVVDCDEFTREFCAQIGKTQPTGEEFPVDQFTKKNTVNHDTFHKLMHPQKEFMEAKLGRPMGIDIHATQKFLQFDGKVLRFYILWDDETMYGEKRPYVMHYFLADDTIEILEIRQHNNGRDKFPAFLKRQKLPKHHSDVVVNMASLGFRGDHRTNYYTAEDFRVGGEIDVYGRKLLICGCDRFTQDYFMSQLGFTAADFPKLVQMEDPVDSVPQLAPPPYTGYGTEEDSLGSFLFLTPKIPKKDFKKLMENDGIKIRWVARFPDARPADKDRRFVITYYLNSDELGIFEKAERNSGFVGGKFLERQRVKNPATGEYFRATDLRAGAIVNINHFIFELLEADLYTQRFMLDNPATFGLTPETIAAAAGVKGAPAASPAVPKH